MNCLLVHGMGRTPASMLLLAWSLRRAGHRPRLFGYLAWLQSFDRIVERLCRKTARLAADGPWLGAGHSLGGLLLRVAAARCPEHAPVRIVQLGTPNTSPRRARHLGDRWFYRLAFGDAGQLLADRDRMAALPLPPCPVTVVVGTGGRRGPRAFFGDEANDGIVGVRATRLDAGDGTEDLPEVERVELPLRHTFMMNAAPVRRLLVARADAASRG